MRFTTSLVLALTAALILSWAGATPANAAGGKNKTPKIRGKIVSVSQDGTSMVITPMTGHGKKALAAAPAAPATPAAPADNVTVTFAAGCTFTMSGQSVTVKSLAPGDFVMVSPTADAATDVKIRAPGGGHKHAGKKPAAATT